MDAEWREAVDLNIGVRLHDTAPGPLSRRLGFAQCRGFSCDQTRKPNIVAAMTAICAKYATDMRTGTSDPDTGIPRMRAEMEAAGIRELADDINTRLGAWLGA